MTKEHSLFVSIGQGIDNAEQGQLFGKPCFKVRGKAFICFFREEMVFKLAGDAHRDALGLAGATLFDPSGKGRPMKEWVQLPAAHAGRWSDFAREAAAYAAAGT